MKLIYIHDITFYSMLFYILLWHIKSYHSILSSRVLSFSVFVYIYIYIYTVYIYIHMIYQPFLAMLLYLILTDSQIYRPWGQKQKTNVGTVGSHLKSCVFPPTVEVVLQSQFLYQTALINHWSIKENLGQLQTILQFLAFKPGFTEVSVHLA